MIIKIDDDFRKHGLTLEEAFILSRVRCFEDKGLEYNESNETLAEMLGKGKTTIKTCINELVKKGLLHKRVEAKSRVLFTQVVENKPLVVENKPLVVKNEPHAEIEETTSINGLSLEEKVQRMKEALQMNKDPNYDSTEELY